MKKSVFTMFGVLGVLALSPQAHATLLLPNLTPGNCLFETAPILCTQAVGNAATAPGTQIASITDAIDVSNTTNTATFVGTFTSTVYEEAGGTLDFYFQLAVSPTSTADLSSLDVSTFAHWITLVGTSSITLPGITGTTSAEPTLEITRDPGPGDTISEGLFSGVFTPGETLLTLAVSTSATGYTVGSDSFRGDQGTSGELSGFEPDIVPEPVSIILGGTVLSLSALWMRRRRNNGAKV